MSEIQLEWLLGKRKLADLKEWDKNPRKITEANFERLKGRIKARGFHDVLKVDTDNTILSGNMRKRALTELGVEEVDVKYPSRPLTEEERQKVALESNFNDGQNDWDMLANEFEPELLLDVGFTEKDIGLDTLPPDGDPLPGHLDTYLNGDVRQVVLYFNPEEFEYVIPALDEMLKQHEVQDYSQLMLKLLGYVPNNP